MKAVIDCPIKGLPKSIEYYKDVFGNYSLSGYKELSEVCYTDKIGPELEKLTDGKWNNVEQFVKDNLLAKPGTLNPHFYINYQSNYKVCNNVLLNKGRYFETSFQWENEYKIKRHILRKMCEPFGIDFSYGFGCIAGNKNLLPHYVGVVEKLTGYKPHVYIDWI